MRSKAVLARAVLLSVTAPIAVLWVVAAQVCADDGRKRERGGTVELIRSPHPHVVLERERVTIDLYPRQATVRCEFHFRNTGPGQRVLMGFPDIGGGESYRGLQGFTSWVDGRRARTRFRREDSSGDGRGGGWHTKKVSFAAGQRRTVRNTYRQRYEILAWREVRRKIAPRTFRVDSDVWKRGFAYVLGTGATWKGAIGTVEIVVRPHVAPNGRVAEASVAPVGSGSRKTSLLPRRRAGGLEWRLRDFEPGRDTRVWIVLREVERV